MISETKLDACIKELFAGITFPKEPRGLYDPLRYMIEIGGKRIRPRLCLTAYSLFRDRLSDEVAEPARALEVFHSFTLMHDDIMDNSPLRRGQATVWKKWGRDTAILSGDVMLIDACRRVAMAPAAVRSEVLDLFSETAALVCEGQQMDMDFELRTKVPMEEYARMTGLKTAVLLACSAKMGALIGGASPQQCAGLYNYGYELGMAFQVADDYLDAFGDEKTFGKPIGGDILNCKKSWLTVRACEKASDMPGLLRALAAPAETEEEKGAKITYVKNIYRELEVDKDAREAIKAFNDRALEAAQGLGLGGVRVEVLRRFADNLTGRAK